MNCRGAIKLLVVGKTTGNAELEEHLATCTKCRQRRTIILDLEQLGGERRRGDISPISMHETRLQASAILASRLKLSTGSSAATPTRFLWRPILASCAATILVAAIIFAWLRATPWRAGWNATLSAQEAATLDTKIDLLARRVGDDLRGFRDRNRENELLTGVEAISASLRIDIASSTMALKLE
ncbi:MAG: hypothetical protein WCP86_02730 [bacterium]